jgi:hypothetical protein
VTDQEPETSEPTIDIESIMREVRAEIIRQSSPTGTEESGTSGPADSRDIADFHLYLYQARAAFDVTGIDLEVGRVALPIIGPLLTRVREMLHELVIFYVLKLAARQKEFNRQTLDALTTLGAVVEANSEARSQQPPAP